MKTIPNLKTRIATRLMRTQSICAVLLLYLLTMTSGWAQDHWVVNHFNGLDGNAPRSLLHSNGTLFGTTAWGGSSNCGTVFKLDTDGSNFMVLKEFTGRDGAYPSGALVLSGMTLYGRTSEGGISNRGTVFLLSNFHFVIESLNRRQRHAVGVHGADVFVVVTVELGMPRGSLAPRGRCAAFPENSWRPNFESAMPRLFPTPPPRPRRRSPVSHVGRSAGSPGWRW